MIQSKESLTRREVLSGVKEAVLVNPSIAEYPQSLGVLSEAGEQHFNGFWYKLLKDAAKDAIEQKSYVFDRGTELALTYQDGNKLEVIGELIDRYINLVSIIPKGAQIKKIYGFEEEDARQQAVFGIYSAAEEFDITRRQKFDTFATWKIRGALTEAEREGGRTIRIPASHQELISKYKKAQDRLWAEQGSEPTVEQIAKKIGVRPERICYVLLDAESTSPVSIHAKKKNGLTEHSSLIPDETAFLDLQTLDYKALKSLLKKAVHSLPERERQLIKMRFGLWGEPELKVRERANRLGIRSKDTVRTNEIKALEIVKDFLLEQRVCYEELLSMEGVD